MPTLIVFIFVIGLLIGAVFVMYKNKGKSGCDGCSKCSKHDLCQHKDIVTPK